MEMKPFINIITAMDETNAIGHEKQIPWAPLPTDYYWYLTHATTTKDPLKRVALILGRITFDEVILFDQKYFSRWHFIVMTRQSSETFCKSYSNIDRNLIDVVNSFDQAALRAKELIETPSAMVESAFVFGGVGPYEQALASKLVKRVYLTRIFAEFPQCDARVSNFDLKDFRRIKRPSNEILAELDDKICEENGRKYQFQVYNLTACQALQKFLSNFGRIIYDNVGGKLIGVDLSQQSRREKFQSCYQTLHEIRYLLEDRSKNPVDLSLKQAFDDNLRLLNACQRS